IDRLTLAIPRAGVLTGVLLDDAGDPAFGTPVRALRWVMQSGVRSLLLAATATADDRGTYRIPGLPPGDYVVSAVATAPAGERGYVPVYFPGTTDFAAVSTIALGVSE